MNHSNCITVLADPTELCRHLDGAPYEIKLNVWMMLNGAADRSALYREYLREIADYVDSQSASSILETQQWAMAQTEETPCT